MATSIQAMEVPIEQIRASPFQPRIKFDLEELKTEIEVDGLLSPIIVRKVGSYYELIDGERRLRALKELGWKRIPVEIRPLDDRLAKVSIWKLNTIRESYSIEERARYFKRLTDSGMSFYQVAKELNISDNWVLAHVNVFKFPRDIQDAVWEGQISMAHVQELESIISANIDEASKIARTVLERRLTRDELRRSVTERVKAVEEARVNAATEAIKEDSRGGTISVDLEQPRELEKAAKSLLAKAKQKREEALTPEDKAREERYREHRQKSAEQARRTVEEQVRARVVQEVRVERATELLKDPETIRTALKNPEVRQAAQQILMPTEPIKTEEREFPKHWADELEQDPPEVQEGNRLSWNLERIENMAEDLHVTPMFYTTSYSGRNLPTFVELMKAGKVGIVYDIRDAPFSQFRPEFNKENLAKTLKSAGIDYRHLPELGVKREVRDELAKSGDYATFWKKYDAGLKDEKVQFLLEEMGKRLENSEGEPFALLCAERDPQKCHRHRIALYLKEEWGSCESLDV